MKSFLMTIFLICIISCTTGEQKMKTEPKIKIEQIEYVLADTTYEGYIAYDETINGKRPVVMVVHEWFGIGPYSKKRAEQLAELGYLGFAIDMYSKDVRPKNTQEAGKCAGLLKKDRKLMRDRITLAYEVIKVHKLADPKRVAAIGYCFGGTTVLEFARSGADIKGIVSFHGALDNPKPEDAKNIKCKVLVCHGADDPFIPQEDITAFQNEMKNAKVDWQMIFYGGAVHSFTNPNAGNDKTKGAAYDESTDKRSWKHMIQFFLEIFK